MKSINIFLSNDYKTLRWWTVTKEGSFKVDKANTIISQWTWKKKYSGFVKNGVSWIFSLADFDRCCFLHSIKFFLCSNITLEHPCKILDC